ncbi:MAG: GNAT family N-acetyltransferase [Pseudomonadota bacterium]
MISVRRLGESDLLGFRAMNALYSDVFDEPENYSEKPPSEAYVSEWLANPNHIALLAEGDGAAVGALSGYILPKFEQQRSELYIYDLAVRETYRRRGVATALIAETRRIARSVGAWTIFVQADTTIEDKPAQALYRKLSNDEASVLHFDLKP